MESSKIFTRRNLISLAINTKFNDNLVVFFWVETGEGSIIWLLGVHRYGRTCHVTFDSSTSSLVQRI